MFTCLFSYLKEGRTSPLMYITVKIFFAFTDTERLYDRFDRAPTENINSQYSKNDSFIPIFICFSNFYPFKQHFETTFFR